MHTSHQAIDYFSALNMTKIACIIIVRDKSFLYSERRRDLRSQELIVMIFKICFKVFTLSQVLEGAAFLVLRNELVFVARFVLYFVGAIRINLIDAKRYILEFGYGTGTFFLPNCL